MFPIEHANVHSIYDNKMSMIYKIHYRWDFDIFRDISYFTNHMYNLSWHHRGICLVFRHEWVINFNVLCRTVDSEVHVIYISHSIQTCTWTLQRRHMSIMVFSYHNLLFHEILNQANKKDTKLHIACPLCWETINDPAQSASNAGIVSCHNVIMKQYTSVIPVSADALAPKGTRPSSDTQLTEKFPSGHVSFKFL